MATSPEMLKRIRSLQSKLLDVAAMMNELQKEDGAIIQFEFQNVGGEQKLTKFQVLAPMDLAKLSS